MRVATSQETLHMGVPSPARSPIGSHTGERTHHDGHRSPIVVVMADYDYRENRMLWGHRERLKWSF